MRERANVWGLRALALVGAIAIWFFASMSTREHQSEKLVDASVTYVPPRGLIILDPVPTVRVRLRGPDRRIRAVTPFSVDVVVAPDETQPGTIAFPLTEENVARPEDLDVVSIVPNEIALRLDREEEQQLAIVPRLVGEPAAGAVPLRPEVRPATASVTGPASILRRWTSVTTSPVDLDGHAFTFQETVAVVSPDPLLRVAEPAVVTVRVPMQTPGLPPPPENP